MTAFAGYFAVVAPWYRCLLVADARVFIYNNNLCGIHGTNDYSTGSLLDDIGKNGFVEEESAVPSERSCGHPSCRAAADRTALCVGQDAVYGFVAVHLILFAQSGVGLVRAMVVCRHASRADVAALGLVYGVSVNPVRTTCLCPLFDVFMRTLFRLTSWLCTRNIESNSQGTQEKSRTLRGGHVSSNFFPKYNVL